MNRILILFAFVTVFWSCKNDDDTAPGTEVEITPPRPPAEVAPENDSAIQEYLRTHYYNYAEFEMPVDSFDYKIRIRTITENDTLVRPLLDDAKAVTIKIADSLLTGEGTGVTDHTYYYIEARNDAAAQKPTVADSTFLRYEGSLLNGTLFDANPTFSWQYLGSTIRAYSDAISKFNSGSAIIDNPNGTVTAENSGIGIVIMPSALGYYNQAQEGIPAFSPLVFTFEVGVFISDTDFDNDGVPSIMEDINGDGNLNNDNTDGDSFISGNRRRALYNHQDTDDDGDGTPTRDEVTFDAAGNLILPLPDADNDGVPDYLDADTK